MICVWWNLKVIGHYEHREYGRTINAKVYCRQLDWLQNALRRNYPTFIDRINAMFIHDNLHSILRGSEITTTTMTALFLFTHNNMADMLLPCLNNSWNCTSVSLIGVYNNNKRSVLTKMKASENEIVKIWCASTSMILKRQNLHIPTCLYR